MATLLMIGGLTNCIYPSYGNKFSQQELRSAIGGIPKVIELNGKDVLVIDKNGKNRNKQINTAATRRLWSNKGLIDLIMGNAVLCTKFEIS